MTIATGPAKQHYRTNSDMSHYESKIRDKHSHEMEVRQKLKGLCS